MPLFSDRRGRFFLLPDDVLERYEVASETSGEASDPVDGAPGEVSAEASSHGPGDRPAAGSDGAMDASTDDARGAGADA